ncbi:class I adenylate-forming enzyme family protein [Defluviitalea raffinosedens]|uniref:AMP-binding protein n=1 Tax=Defluviitalea raffinosedens TaxID=1450156 RepID=A0A7C8LTL1_9FIRM|nr:class I adenylate-forming enzyme family protein [Defluviitalea raffinosedens]KAE9634942.1 AMP-binding protein [Defluviitalea raffinosedens]MBM7685732.1 acyl-CoA synthetase (AMP-forming)/AMP-acid ligase II [Defluviitalea raffinosedens]HHW66574.1 acyl--CoA ligase [Candidatus Epulonipiscium sp.]
MPITEILSRNAELYGQETCLVEINLELQESHNVIWREYELIENNPAGEYRLEMTWRVFNEKANRLANLLLKRGIKKGDKVAILLMNCLEWLPIYFGILKAGAVAVPLNFRYTAEEIKYCLDLSDTVALIFGPEFIGRLESIYDQIPRVKTLFYAGENRPSFAESYDRLTANCSSETPQVELSDEDDAAIYFSSGTTGFPKAILHTHRSLMAACYTEYQHHGQTHEDNFLCIPPLYHTGAKMHWFGSLLSGSKAVLLRGIKPEWILKTVSEEKITIVWLLVPWAQDILDAIERGDVKLEDYDLSQWRLMHIGAQPVPPSLIHRWKKYFPNHLYDTNYGLSESTGPGCVHLGTENIHKVGAIGIPGYKWEARIVDEQGNSVPQGEVGELAVKGDGVMKCYYKDPESTAAVIKNGWLFTGDMARMDEDGFIYLVDRKKDVIISGGENIYPVQIEDFLRAHEAIKDVAVIGLPDQRLGEIAAAIIELKSGYTCTEEEIKAFCTSMPRYKRPKKIIFDKVPRNPTGKIEKPKLREKYGASGLVAAQVEIRK